MCVFDVCSDGLFPAPDLGNLGLKHWRFRELFSYWIYYTLDNGDNEDQADPYWATDQMAQQFNDHCNNYLGMGEMLRLMKGYSGAWHMINQGEVTRLTENQEDFDQIINAYLQLGSN